MSCLYLKKWKRNEKHTCRLNLLTKLCQDCIIVIIVLEQQAEGTFQCKIGEKIESNIEFFEELNKRFEIDGKDKNRDKGRAGWIAWSESVLPSSCLAPSLPRCVWGVRRGHTQHTEEGVAARRHLAGDDVRGGRC